MEMFKYNEFKLRILRDKVKTETTTVYRCGPLIDLCRGPHVRNTGKIKSIAVIKNSAAYWEGNAEAESLQRIYGISFPDAKQMKEWKAFQEEAAKRDHRKIGRVGWYTFRVEAFFTRNMKSLREMMYENEFESCLLGLWKGKEHPTSRHLHSCTFFLGSRAVLLPRTESRVLLFPTQGGSYLQQVDGLHKGGVLEARISRG